MDWSQERTLIFLEGYQAEPVVWDPKHKDHKDRNKTHDAWMRLESLVNTGRFEEEKKSLLPTYRGYRRRVEASIKSVAGADDLYHPVWFVYDMMDTFLGHLSANQQ
nr:unnamed protein product [Callosobruchus analis]